MYNDNVKQKLNDLYALISKKCGKLDLSAIFAYQKDVIDSVPAAVNYNMQLSFLQQIIAQLEAMSDDEFGHDEKVLLNDLYLVIAFMERPHAMEFVKLCLTFGVVVPNNLSQAIISPFIMMQLGNVMGVTPEKNMYTAQTPNHVAEYLRGNYSDDFKPYLEWPEFLPLNINPVAAMPMVSALQPPGYVQGVFNPGMMPTNRFSMAAPKFGEMGIQDTAMSNGGAYGVHPFNPTEPPVNFNVSSAPGAGRGPLPEIRPEEWEGQYKALCDLKELFEINSMRGEDHAKRYTFTCDLYSTVIDFNNFVGWIDGLRKCTVVPPLPSLITVFDRQSAKPQTWQYNTMMKAYSNI